jgi:hypothetical protein
LRLAVLQGFKPEKPQSLFQNRAPGCAGNVSARSISFGTGSIYIAFLHGYLYGQEKEWHQNSVVFLDFFEIFSIIFLDRQDFRVYHYLYGYSYVSIWLSILTAETLFPFNDFTRRVCRVKVS